jgi:hypothetical protein
MMSSNAFYAGMEGLVGTAMAKSFEAFLVIEADMPTTAEILNDPYNTRLPKTNVEQLMMVYRLGMNVGKQTVDRVAAYVKRMNGENRALFTHLVTNSASSVGLVQDMYRLGFIEDNKDLRTA